MKFQNGKRVLELDDQFISTIIMALEETFQTFWNTKIEKKPISVSDARGFPREVSSIIGFVQDYLEGTSKLKVR